MRSYEGSEVMRTLPSREDKECFADKGDIQRGRKGVNKYLEEGKCGGFPPKKGKQNDSKFTFQTKQKEKSTEGGGGG